jgi:hypothetical protein
LGYVDSGSVLNLLLNSSTSQQWIEEGNAVAVEEEVLTVTGPPVEVEEKIEVCSG